MSRRVAPMRSPLLPKPPVNYDAIEAFLSSGRSSVSRTDLQKEVISGRQLEDPEKAFTILREAIVYKDDKYLNCLLSNGVDVGEYGDRLVGVATDLIGSLACVEELLKSSSHAINCDKALEKAGNQKPPKEERDAIVKRLLPVVSTAAFDTFVENDPIGLSREDLTQIREARAAFDRKLKVASVPVTEESKARCAFYQHSLGTESEATSQYLRSRNLISAKELGESRKHRRPGVEIGSQSYVDAWYALEFTNAALRLAPHLARGVEAGVRGVARVMPSVGDAVTAAAGEAVRFGGMAAGEMMRVGAPLVTEVAGAAVRAAGEAARVGGIVVREVTGAVAPLATEAAGAAARVAGEVAGVVSNATGSVVRAMGSTATDVARAGIAATGDIANGANAIGSAAGGVVDTVARALGGVPDTIVSVPQAMELLTYAEHGWDVLKCVGECFGAVLSGVCR